MPRQPETGDIGHRMGHGGQNVGGCIQRAFHHPVGGFNPSPFGQQAHFGGQNGAGANGFGQDQNIARQCTAV